MKDNQRLSERMTGHVATKRDAGAGAAMAGMYSVVCRDKHGDVKWREEIHNRVVNEGLDYLLETALAAGTQIASWFVGLTDGAPTVAAGDTLASHAGWTEVTAYTGDRQAFTAGAVSGQSVDNSGAAAEFPITASATVGGAFLASAATGTAGTLYSAGAFSGGNRSLDNGDTLTVEATFTASVV
mgnify:CR=1 FL=1